MPVRRTSVSAAELAKLGADRLADILVERAAGDAVLERRLRLLLGAADPARLVAEVGRRIQQMARARSEMDFERAKAVAREVADLHRTIVDDLAPTRPADAVDGLWKLLGLAPALLGRADHGSDRIGAAVAAAVADLGRLTAALPDVDSKGLARRVAAAIDGDGTMATDGLLAAMADALGPEGRAAMREDALAALARLPADDVGWQARGRRYVLVARLLELADMEEDVDAYAAAAAAGGSPELHSAEVARRLLAAGRAAEGLDWIDRHPPRLDPDTTVDLRLDLLTALGRSPEAQALRRAHFERTLSARHLRAYLKSLPDFEDFAAEQQALDHVMASRHASPALDFLVAWPDIDRAARMATDRLETLDLGDHYAMLRAAEAIEPRHPEASVRLRRRVALQVLRHGASSGYADAALALVDAGRTAARLAAADIEPHEAYVDALRRDHRRKWRFWQLYDEAG